MSDIGNPFGVDLATTIFGAGLSLVVSAGAMIHSPSAYSRLQARVER